MQESYLAYYAVGLLLFIFAGKYIFDYQFEITKRNRYMEAQLRLLTQIAAAQGVNQDKIAEIIADAEIPKPPKRLKPEANTIKSN